MKCKKCKDLDHYKCTRIEDHKAGKHSIGFWWCELCAGLKEPKKIK